MTHNRERFVLLQTPWTPLERVCLAALCLLVLLIVLLLGRSARAQTQDPRVALGLVTQPQLDGARLFFAETFRGNGRTCGTCHPAEHNLTFDPLFARRQPATALLFAPSVPGLERTGQLKRRALVLENLDGFADPTRVFVFRATPHVLSLSLTRTRSDPAAAGEPVGWSGDGAPAPGTLRDFATGAVTQHFTRTLARVPGADFRLPNAAELDAMLAFLDGLGRVAELDLEAVRLIDPAAERGRRAFLRVGCNGCHFNAGANASPDFGGANQSFDTGINALRHPTAPNDDAAGDGNFNTPPLIEAADTPPFFHNNAADTIEDAVLFYRSDTFRAAPGGFPLQMTETEAAEIAATLRALNAALNAQMALQRLRAARRLLVERPGGHVAASRLIALAAEEALDGYAVLFAGGAHGAAIGDFLAAFLDAQRAGTTTGGLRLALLDRAIAGADRGLARIGARLEMTLGTSNLAM